MASRSESPQSIDDDGVPQMSPLSTTLGDDNGNDGARHSSDRQDHASQRPAAEPADRGHSGADAGAGPIQQQAPTLSSSPKATDTTDTTTTATATATATTSATSTSNSAASPSHPKCCSRNHSHSHPHSRNSHSHCDQTRSSSLGHSHSRSHASRAASNDGADGARASGSTAPHSRTTSRNTSHDFKETLNARSRDMDDGSRIINQYRMTEVIGQGSYGTVHRATLADDPSVTFAIKEFGKTRLRKSHRASNMKRSARGKPGARGSSRPRGGFVAAHDSYQNERQQQQDGGDGNGNGGGGGGGGAGSDDLKDPLMLIRHEMAILKKLHHPHVVKLYEVLDDPSKDSLYMVFEHCPDGAVIDIRLHHQSEPLDEPTARSYFVQVMLGIEYLHSNDIVHRDLKPDNILLSDGGRTCKIVDFGVSEMFLKPGDDKMQKSAGSPAFMSPELCTAGHSWYHGRSDDIWSFGVTVYCMVVGRLPFDKDNFFEMYEAIKAEEPEYPSHLSPELKDLLQKLLRKDPEKRITIDEMRRHPWVTCNGTASIISSEENLEQVVFEITEEELDCAICKITNIFTFARAISKFKKGGSMNRARREASQALSDAEAKKQSGDDGQGAAIEGQGDGNGERKAGRAGADAAAAGERDSLQVKVDALRNEIEHPEQQQEVLLVDSPTSDTIELPPLDELDDGDAAGAGAGDDDDDTKLRPGPDALRRTKTDPAGEAAAVVLSRSPDLCDSPTSCASTPADAQVGEKDGSAEATGSHSEDLARRLADVVMREGGADNAWKSKEAMSEKKKRVSILMSATTGELHTSRDHLAREYVQQGGSQSGGSGSSAGSQGDRPARKPTPHRAPPKVLVDEETVSSPRSENIPTPPGASEAHAEPG
ncbi:uncharacterized protein PSFLO_07725 [Pseudozyma flocculosa]|uniref:Protein kinase domain-containing protein n=1 Tax=Pseudozyma flocculosa TaxID=84751 RepID=A0A5C3FCV3_9BASI|nr:uncharacterized protein PSFLO_07725 [Pseudozyma flocculosa]